MPQCTYEKKRVALKVCTSLPTYPTDNRPFFGPTIRLVVLQNLHYSLPINIMCRLCLVMYYDCGHVHQYYPLNPCEAGFRFGKPGRCLAETRASPRVADEYCLENRPDCPVCLENSIRDRYALEQTQVVKEAKSHGLTYAAIKPDIQDVQSRMTKEISKLKREKAQFENDWTTAGKTQWTEGIREVVWNRDTRELVAFEQCGRMSSWEPDDDPRIELWLDSVEHPRMRGR